MNHICSDVTCSCGCKYCANCYNGCPQCGAGKPIYRCATNTGSNELDDEVDIKLPYS